VKVANFFTEIKPQICQHQCQIEFPNFGFSQLVWNLSRLEGHVWKRQGWGTEMFSHSGWFGRDFLCSATITHF